MELKFKCENRHESYTVDIDYSLYHLLRRIAQGIDQTKRIKISLLNLSNL